MDETLVGIVLDRISRKQAPFEEDIVDAGIAAAYLSQELRVKINPIKVALAMDRIEPVKVVPFKTRVTTRHNGRKVRLRILRNSKPFYVPNTFKLDLDLIRDAWEVIEAQHRRAGLL